MACSVMQKWGSKRVRLKQGRDFNEFRALAHVFGYSCLTGTTLPDTCSCDNVFLLPFTWIISDADIRCVICQFLPLFVMADNGVPDVEPYAEEWLQVCDRVQVASQLLGPP